MEERMVEWRRQRKMEEERNAADQVIVNTAIAAPAAHSTASEDPLQRLTKLKSMLDAGLIDQSEFDAAKARILASM
jgi:membrane protease subunit (stomatin/prohibitin family)